MYGSVSVPLPSSFMTVKPVRTRLAFALLPPSSAPISTICEGLTNGRLRLSG